jgi:hypothetical protein
MSAGKEATMTQEQVRCPACGLPFTKRGLRLHFQQALLGWDRERDPREPHVHWVRDKGIWVADTGAMFNFDRLNDALDEYLSGQ